MVGDTTPNVNDVHYESPSKFIPKSGFRLDFQ